MLSHHLEISMSGYCQNYQRRCPRRSPCEVRASQGQRELACSQGHAAVQSCPQLSIGNREVKLCWSNKPPRYRLCRPSVGKVFGGSKGATWWSTTLFDLLLEKDTWHRNTYFSLFQSRIRLLLWCGFCWESESIFGAIRPDHGQVTQWMDCILCGMSHHLGIKVAITGRDVNHWGGIYCNVTITSGSSSYHVFGK